MKIEWSELICSNCKNGRTPGYCRDKIPVSNDQMAQLHRQKTCHAFATVTLARTTPKHNG